MPISEAPEHPHLRRAATFVEHEGSLQPRAGAALLPDRRRRSACRRHPQAGAHTREALAAWGIADVDGLIASGVAVQA